MGARLFGGERRSVEAASATSEAVAADLSDLQLALAASVACEYLLQKSLGVGWMSANSR